MNGIAAAPDECPRCGSSLETFRVTSEDEPSVARCGACSVMDRGDPVIWESNFAAVELPLGERACTAYPHDEDHRCGGKLELVEAGLYKCQSCGRYYRPKRGNSGAFPAQCCPICLETAALDFHHWDYDRDIGIHICRDCHTELHDGVRARDQTEAAPGDEDWRVDASNNLIGMHESRHGRADSWDEFFERYNIPKDVAVFTNIYELEL